MQQNSPATILRSEPLKGLSLRPVSSYVSTYQEAIRIATHHKITSLKADKSNLMQISGLKDIKKELGLRRNSLVKAMIAEIERAIYEDLQNRAHVDTGPSSPGHDRSSSKAWPLQLQKGLFDVYFKSCMTHLN